MIRVLFVDDDSTLLQLVAEFCSSHDISVDGVTDGQHIEAVLSRGDTDVLLLDVGLPGEDGFSICRRLRVQHPTLPIIVVSGRRDDLDRILGLELGADDYITKPFVPRELVARIKAVHRRSGRVVAGAGEDAGTAAVARFGPFVVDLRRRGLSRDGVNVALTNAEFELLSVFCKNPGRSLKRSEIMEALSSVDESAASERGIDVTVVRLRKLLEEDPKAPNYIKTVWRVGYVFTP